MSISSQKDTLPAFKPAANPHFRGGAKEGADFAKSVREVYEETVHWRRNVLLVPSGKVGKEFVRELTRLFNAYTDFPRSNQWLWTRSC